MYLENDPLGYGPNAHHLSPPASLARVSPQDSDPLSDPIYHDRAPYSYR